MDIRVLRYFLEVAREENITKAAEKLHMSQPPLSRQLKELETELGKQLLVRGSKRVTLTEDGKLLRKRAEEIVELMEKTRSELESSDKDIGGDIYIGSGETSAISLLAKTAGEIKKKYPNIRYHIYSGDAEHIEERLDKGLIDIGLLIGEANIEKYESIELPITDVWGILMRKDCPLSEKKSVRPEDIRNMEIMTSYQSVNDKTLTSWFGTDISKLNIVLKYNLLYNASLFVKNDFGCAFALEGLADVSENSGLCFRPFEPPVYAKLYIVWKKNQVFSREAEVFMRELKKNILTDK